MTGSPYTSTLVDNPPPDSDIVALNHQGSQTLTFFEAIANPVSRSSVVPAARSIIAGSVTAATGASARA
jgi:hypothetical protein